MIRWHKADMDNRMYCTVDGDKKISMPRYYKNKIYNDGERKTIGWLNLQKIREREYEMASKNRMYARNKREAQAAYSRQVQHSLKTKIDKL